MRLNASPSAPSASSRTGRFARRQVISGVAAVGASLPAVPTGGFGSTELAVSSSGHPVSNRSPSAALLRSDLDFARDALRGGDFRNAYLAFRAASRGAPNDFDRASAALGACETLLADDLPDEATEQLTEWIDAFPTDPRQFVARIMLARALQASARPGTSVAAIGAWREVLYVGAVPCADAVRVRLASLLASLGRGDEASTELVSAQTEIAGSGAAAAAKLLVSEAMHARAIASRDAARTASTANEIFDAIVKVGRLPGDIAEAAWRVVAAALGAGDSVRADAIRWQVIGEWPETPIAWQAATELGPERVPADARAAIAAANGKWEAVRDSTQWLLANAPGHPEVGPARALRGIAASALREPGADGLLDAGGIADGGPRWGAKAIWEAAERRRLANDLDGASARYTKLAATFPATLEAAQANYQLGRILPGLGDVVRANQAMNLAADVGPVGFHAVRARQVLRRTLPKAPSGTDAFVASGVITSRDWYEWDAWLRARSLVTPETSGDLAAPDLDVAGRRLDALLASGLYPEAQDAARELCQRRGFAPATVASVANRLRAGGYISFSMTLGHRLLRVLEAAGETSTLALPAVPKKLAYPLAYARLVAESASRESIDPFLLLALMKQESWFDPHAESKANARGLTQFIRPTARAVALELNWPNWAWDDLFHPYVAVPFGAHYLASLLREFRGNVLLATAAYNAGPSPVLKWVGGDWAQDPDHLVAAITYRETRAYVTSIATYAEVYRDTYGTA